MNPRPVCVCFPPLPIRSRRCDAARRHAAELRVTPLRNARSIRVASENVWYPHELVSGAKQSSLTTSTWNSPVRPTSRSAADAPVFAQQRLGLGAGEIRTGAGALSLDKTRSDTLDVGRQGGEAERQCTSYSLCWALCAPRWEPARTSSLRTWRSDSSSPYSVAARSALGSVASIASSGYGSRSGGHGGARRSMWFAPRP